MDDKKKVGKPDAERINVNEPYELSEWSKKLGVPPAVLKTAVEAVGPMTDNVRKHLGK